MPFWFCWFGHFYVAFMCFRFGRKTSACSSRSPSTCHHQNQYLGTRTTVTNYICLSYLSSPWAFYAQFTIIITAIVCVYVISEIRLSCPRKRRTIKCTFFLSTLSTSGWEKMREGKVGSFNRVSRVFHTFQPFWRARARERNLNGC